MTQLAKQKMMMLFITLTLLIAFAGFLIANQSLAWFSENKSSDVNGVYVNAKISPSLIIGKSPAELSQSNPLFSVDFSTAATDMVAVTHDADAGATNLKYIDNYYAIDKTTGLADAGETLDFVNVPEADNERYFIDCTVYIASAFHPLEASSLKASIVLPSSVDPLHTYFMAASIDFYIEEVSDSNYKGTTSVADAVNSTDDTAAGVELLADGGETIPLCEDGYIKVIMRCYFDGALTTPDGSKAYVNSYEVRADGVSLGVEFSVTDRTAETGEGA